MALNRTKGYLSGVRILSDEQVEALAGRLAYLAEEMFRFNRLLIEHEAQGHPEARGGLAR